MRNRNLLNAIENYIIEKKKMELGTFAKFKKAKISLESELSNVDISDITEIFTDLRDYWDTLEVGK